MRSLKNRIENAIKKAISGDVETHESLWRDCLAIIEK